MKALSSSWFLASTLLVMAACSKSELITDELSASAPATEAVEASSVSPVQVYGLWHAGNDYCTWSSIRSLSEFDNRNHWIIDRENNQTYKPSVNLVVLSFVHPLNLLNNTTTQNPLAGIPIGMTPEIINYFKERGIRVMLSIGGITYTSAWNQALLKNPTQLGLNAALVAKTLGVGIEIDYEESSSPDLLGLSAFITAYRSEIPYDASGNNHAARLTIDLAAGGRWLIGICREATDKWLRPENPVLDYANAMVPARQPRSASDAIANWQEHIDGKPRYGPPIPPGAPCKFTAGLYITSGSKPIAECVDYNRSLISSTSAWVQSCTPKGVGISPGFLGYMFWAAECPSTRSSCTVGNNSCYGGVGAGAAALAVTTPMPPLRQQ